MNRNMSPERQKAILCACAVACMAGLPVLLRGHRVLMFCGIAVQVFFLVMALVLLNKAMAKEKATKIGR